MPPRATLLRRRRPTDRTRGAAAVEAALVLPVVLALFVGIIEFGLLFKDSLALSSGVRAAARIAAADPTNATDLRTYAPGELSQSLQSVDVSGSPAPRMWVYDPDSAASPPGSCPASSCLAFAWDGAHATFGAATGTWDPCAGAGSTRVSVLVQVRHRGITGLALATRTLDESATFRFVPSTSGSVC